MRYCILVSHCSSLNKFLKKLAEEVIKKDECLLAAESKFAEYLAKEFFPKEVKILSKVDWCINNYEKNQEEFSNISWKEFFPDYDRFKLFGFGYQKSHEAISQIYQFFDFVLRKEKPDVVILEPPSGAFSEIAFRLCQKHKIPYLGFISSRIERRLDVFDLEHTCSKYEETFNGLTDISAAEKEFAADFVKKFITHKQLPSYMKYQYVYKNEISRMRGYFRESIKAMLLWLAYISQREHLKHFDYVGEIQLKYRLKYLFKATLLRLKRFLFFQKNIYSRLKENDKFFLFPLHIQPEASTSVLATYFYDLINTAKNIAFSLPFPYKLYVKEHPAVRGDRPKNFYQELKKIPNVVLVSPFENAESLIGRSQGVVTLTSTIGLEAALAGKPVYVLGNVFYSYHPSCRKIKGFEELKEKIKTDLTQKSALRNLDEINRRFVISYARNTIPGDLGMASGKTDTNDYGMILKEMHNYLRVAD